MKETDACVEVGADDQWSKKVHPAKEAFYYHIFHQKDICQLQIGDLTLTMHRKPPNRWWRFWQFMLLGFRWSTTRKNGKEIKPPTRRS